MRDTRDIQQLIEQIQNRSFSEHELIDLLSDARILVVSNALMVLPKYQLSEPNRAINALLDLASGNHQDQIVFGNTPIKKLAAACLYWMQNYTSEVAFKELTATFNKHEQEDLKWFLEQNPEPPNWENFRM